MEKNPGVKVFKCMLCSPLARELSGICLLWLLARKSMFYLAQEPPEKNNPQLLQSCFILTTLVTYPYRPSSLAEESANGYAHTSYRPWFVILLNLFRCLELVASSSQCECDLRITVLLLLPISFQTILHQFPLHQVSYCADDKSDKRMFTFIAREKDQNKHLCFVFDSEKSVS